MNDAIQNTKIAKDISLLYELSLSVGQSLDLKTNCDIFLKTLLARKNLAFASVWIKNEYLVDEEEKDRVTLVYANPEFRIRERHLPLHHPLFSHLKEKEAFSLALSDNLSSDLITEKGVAKGVLAVFALGEIGALKLFSSPEKNLLNKRSLINSGMWLPNLPFLWKDVCCIRELSGKS